MRHRDPTNSATMQTPNPPITLPQPSSQPKIHIPPTLPVNTIHKPSSTQRILKPRDNLAQAKNANDTAHQNTRVKQKRNRQKSSRISKADGSTFRTRKSHQKSHAGCSNCKRRHLKCDEMAPQWYDSLTFWISGGNGC